MIDDTISFIAANPMVIVAAVYIVQIILIYVLWTGDRKIAAVIDIGILFARIVFSLWTGVSV